MPIKPSLPKGNLLQLLLIVFFMFSPSALPASIEKLDKAATQFAQNLQGRMRNLLYNAGAIDPETSKESLGIKEQMIGRQRKLNSWFHDKGKEVIFEECETETDRQNYLEFREIMANKAFLQLEYSKRRRFISTINGYFEEFSNAFATSLKEMLYPSPRQTEDENDKMINRLTQRLRFDVNVKIWYFNKERLTSIGAIYVPNTFTIYLNLNSLIQSPAEFIDAFEHELWHHLLPPSSLERPYENLWWEGFTEATSEIWSSYFFRHVPKRRSLKQTHHVQYPVQTAFASIYLGLHRNLTMAYLAGCMTRKRFVQCFANEPEFHQNKSVAQKGINDGIYSTDQKLKLTTFKKVPLRKPVLLSKEDYGLNGLLAAFFQDPHLMDEKKKTEIELLLKNWGWKEDNYGPITIDRYVKRGKLRAVELAAAFHTEKYFVADLIKAMTLINLRKIDQLNSIKSFTWRLDLPKHLQKNINKIILQSRSLNSFPFYPSSE